MNEILMPLTEAIVTLIYNLVNVSSRERVLHLSSNFFPVYWLAIQRASRSKQSFENGAWIGLRIGIDHSSDLVDDHYLDIGDGEGLNLTSVFFQYQNLCILFLLQIWTFSGIKLLCRIFGGIHAFPD